MTRVTRQPSLPAQRSGGTEGGWLVIHRISFLAWAFFILIHLAAYLPRLPRLLAAEARGPLEVLGGRGTRLALLIASLLAGLMPLMKL